MATVVRDEAALTALRIRTDQGVVEAESALGQALYAQPDAAIAHEGVSRLRRAADSGDAKAQFSLGKLEYLGSAFVSRDCVQSRAHLKRAAEQHEVRAHYYLALLARNGCGAQQDLSEAARELTIAAQGNIPAALFLLANAYRQGEGVSRDEERAVALYERAAEQDHPESIQALAMAYQNGELRLPRDPSRYEQAMQELAHAQKHAPTPP